MKIAPLAVVKDQLSAYIDAAKESAIVVTRNGRPVALLTPILEDDDLASLLLAHDRRFTSLLAHARRRVKAGEYLTSQQFWRELRRRSGRSRVKTVKPGKATRRRSSMAS